MKKREIAFSTTSELNRSCVNRSVVLFGAGPIAAKTVRIIGKNKLHSIVDNASNLWGKFELDLEIKDPKSILGIENIFIIICTTSFAEVSHQLREFGLKQGEDFCVSPILNDLRIIDELETVSKKMLFTNGSLQR